MVLTSKVYFPTGQDINARGDVAAAHHAAVEASLRRLNTDRIDVYFVHRFDENTPVEETMRGMEDLVSQGKILYPGVSNWAAWQTAKALGITECRGYARIQCLQPMYNLVKRQAEVEILPLAISEQVGVITYSPLGGGLLSGKYRTSQRPDSGRLQDNRMYTARYVVGDNLAIAERFADYAAEHGLHPATLAVAWVMSAPGVTAPIIGAAQHRAAQRIPGRARRGDDAGVAGGDLSHEP